MKTIDRTYTIGEEIANSILHGIGALCAMAGLVLLSLKIGGFLGGQRAGSLDIIAALIFTLTMLGMFLVSTLYHAIPQEKAKRILQKLDHSWIFIFIAGTYSPFCLIALRGAWGWSIFAFEWCMAFLGIILNTFDNKKFKKIKTAVYVLMGWAIVAGCVPLIRAIPIQSIVLLFAGGVAYTLGIIWYRKKQIKFTHAIWHAFVILGTICHWFSVWSFVDV